MEQSLKPIYEILALHNKFFKLATGDVSEEDAQKRINGKGNPITHLAGHITSTRFYICSLLGLQEEDPFGEVFMGEYDPNGDLPSLDEITNVFDEITSKLMAQLEKVDSEQLSGGLPQQFPIEEQTVLGGVSFLAEHEGYHIGQMGYLRIQLGYKSIEILFAGA